MLYPPRRAALHCVHMTNYMKLAAARGNHFALMLMMLNSGYLMETGIAANSIPNMLPTREFDLVIGRTITQNRIETRSG